MAHFYGTLQGQRGQASRLGSKSSGLDTTAASWQGSVRVYLRYDEKLDADTVLVSLEPWHGCGISKVLYDGPIGGKASKKAP